MIKLSHLEANSLIYKQTHMSKLFIIVYTYKPFLTSNLKNHSIKSNENLSTDFFFIDLFYNFPDFISNLGTEFCERPLLGLNKTCRKMRDKPTDIPEDKEQTQIQP